MSRSAKPGLYDLFGQAYSDGFAYHGELGLDADDFAAHLIAIVEKHLGLGKPRADVASLICSLHTCDLYLAAACAQHSAAAWSQFLRLYQNYLNNIALSVSPTGDAAEELADCVLADLFLPDRSGRSRISSYHGRSSLATWLRVVVCHRATNERESKYNSLERIEAIPEVVETAAVRNIEAVLRANRYEDMIRDALKGGCECLSDRERLLLLLRYDQELQVSQIARLLGVCPSTVTRQIERVQEKLRENVISTLTTRYRLLQPAIQECLADLLSNPSHSILTIIKEC